MKEIDQYRQFKTKILKERTVHIFGVGFEERCLAYPKFINDANPGAREQAFLCVNPPDEHVSGYLQARREKHRATIKGYLRSTRMAQIDEIEREIEEGEPPDNFCLDISTLPRAFIFRLLNKVLEKSRGEEKGQCKIPIYIIYTYPKNYAYGPLEEPATDVSLSFDNPQLIKGKKVVAIILPGFDRHCTDIALTHIKASTGLSPTPQWQFPFPGRIFAFYERALENHIDLVKDTSISVYPQEEINLAFDRFKREVGEVSSLPVFYVPLGPRITCVSVFLAALWSREKGVNANVLVPVMRSYTSIRSEGHKTPLIEQIHYPAQFHNDQL